VSEQTKFSPDWLSPPGETIESILRDRGLSTCELAKGLNTTENEAKAIIRGRAEITEEIAQQLAHFVGGSEDFWRNRELQYRTDLSRFLQRASSEATRKWLDGVPAREMTKLGWIASSSDPGKLAEEVLQFFGVTSITSWRQIYEQRLRPTAFRASPTFQSHPGAVAAWLRRGEIIASSIHCNRWDSDRYHAELSGIRELTQLKTPTEFLPELTRRCAKCGVSLVVLNAPQQCKASGATCFLTPSRPLLMLSLRHRSDDHFWFTFFHESAHLILHGDKFVFLEFEGDQTLSSKEEDEANAFAEELLIPSHFKKEMLSLPKSPFAIVRFARKIGISPGIVVGQLEHYGKVGHRRFNRLKRRFDWSNFLSD
jgi:plasmid maintenance system antidote protein VapI/Zn-dependent peptidase ImmA (M78 family)